MGEAIQVNCQASDATSSTLFFMFIPVEEVIQVDYEPPVKRRKLQAGASPVSKTKTVKATGKGLVVLLLLSLFLFSSNIHISSSVADFPSTVI